MEKQAEQGRQYCCVNMVGHICMCDADEGCMHCVCVQMKRCAFRPTQPWHCVSEYLMFYFNRLFPSLKLGHSCVSLHACS